MKRFSELLTEAALPKKEPAPKAEPTPQESAESLSKKAVNSSKTADQAPMTAPYADQHAAHLAAADAHHEAANGHLTASQAGKNAELHGMHAATHRSIARNHEKVAAVYAMGATSGKKTVKEEVEVEENLTEAFEILAELSKATLASYIPKAARAAGGAKSYGDKMREKQSNDPVGSPERKVHGELANMMHRAAEKKHRGIAAAAKKLAEDYVDAFVGLEEGFEMLDILSNPFLCELDKSTLASYVTRASSKAAAHSSRASLHSAYAQGHTEVGSHEQAARANSRAHKEHGKALKRLKGVATAAHKLSEEEEPSLLEAVISAARGIRASGYDASADVAAAKARAAARKEAQLKVIRDKYPVKKAEGSDEAKAARAAAKKDMKEEVEVVTELEKKTLASYIKKASHDVAAKSAATSRYAERAHVAKQAGDVGSAHHHNKTADKFFNQSWKRRGHMAQAADKLAEEVEFILEFRQPVDHATLRGKKAKDGSTILYDKHGDIPADKDQQKKIVAKAHELRVAKAKSASAVKEDVEWTDISNLVED